MHRDDIRNVLHQSPFQPFKFVMIDGREFPVPHGDYAHVTLNGTIIYEHTGDKPWLMLNANLVARIEYLSGDEISA